MTTPLASTQPSAAPTHFRAPRGGAFLLFLGVLALVTLFSTSATALIAPLAEEGDRTFITREEGLQLAVVQVEMTPVFDPREQLSQQNSWRVRAEIFLRNISGETRDLLLGFNADTAVDDSLRVLVDGAHIATADKELSSNPLVEVARFTEASTFPLSIESNRGVRIGLEFQLQARRDERGQSILGLPTHLFGLLAPQVDQAFIGIDFNELPAGLASTLSGYTIWNQPWQRLSWYAIDWTPRLPLQIVWVQPWVLLVTMTEVESCPSPLEIVRRMSSGDVRGIEAYLADWQTSDLEFCASLPLAIHGYSFSSERVRTQFSEIELNRYLGTSGERGSIYRENPGFDPEVHLSDAEAVYWRTLQRYARAR